jgi:hypothetical protein
MTAMTEERPIFENEEWLVTGSGLEHKTTGYFIDRESLGQRRGDGLWSWPLHMAEKSWCAMQPFAEAFSCAAAVYGIKTGAELAQTFKVARCEVSSWPKLEKQDLPPAPLVSPALRSGASNPILWEPRSSEKILNSQGFSSPEENWRLRAQARARFRSAHFNTVQATSLPWRTPHRIRQTGTRLVRLIQSAWNIR